MITSEEIQQLNDARDTLIAIRKRVWSHGYEVTRIDTLSHGYAAKAIDDANDAIFDALNVISSYRVAEISEDELHNRKPVSA